MEFSLVIFHWFFIKFPTKIKFHWDHPVKTSLFTGSTFFSLDFHGQNLQECTALQLVLNPGMSAIYKQYTTLCVSQQLTLLV